MAATSRGHLVDASALDRVVERTGRLAKRGTEICGLILRCGNVLQLVETRNVTDRPYSFVIHRGDWKKIEAAATVLGFPIVGTFHSHVLAPAVPGRGDIQGAYSGHLMLIVSTENMKARLWIIKRGKASPLRFRLTRRLVE